MKKLLIGLLAFGSISSFAASELPSCKTQKLLASGDTIEKNFNMYGFKVGSCDIKSTWDGEFYESTVSSNGLNLFYQYTDDKLQSKQNDKAAIEVLRNTLLGCGCTRL